MTWNYAYTPYLWPSASTALFLLALAFYSWRKRGVPGACWLMMSCLFGAAWAACSGMEYAAVGLPAKIAWTKTGAVFQAPIVTAITCFFLEYAWPGRWLTRRNLILLSVPCLLTLASILTNEYHHLAWLGFAYNGKVIWLIGPYFWLLLVYGVGIL